MYIKLFPLIHALINRRRVKHRGIVYRIVVGSRHIMIHGNVQVLVAKPVAPKIPEQAVPGRIRPAVHAVKAQLQITVRSYQHAGQGQGAPVIYAVHIHLQLFRKGIVPIQHNTPMGVHGKIHAACLVVAEHFEGVAEVIWDCSRPLPVRTCRRPDCATR